MKLFRFDAEAGRAIEAFGSINLVVSPIARQDGEVQIICMHLEPGGLVGYHQADSPQLFLVVHGEGWVRGASAQRQSIAAGRAAFWESGEWHEAGTDSGMVAIVIESDTLNPAQLMPEA